MDPNTSLPFEMVVIKGEGITPSLLVWRRYKRKAPAIVEQMLFANPHIVPGLADSPYLPLGAVIRMPIDSTILDGKSVSKKMIKLWGEA